VSVLASLRVFGESGRAWALTLFYFLAFGGFVAMFLYLPKLLTGVVGAAGGLGGFFPPLVMGIVKSATGGYALGFVLLSMVAVACLVVLTSLNRPATVGSPLPA
jgi:nitrate/nitrite transporter NarK